MSSAPATEPAQTEASERVGVDPVFPSGPVSAAPHIERFCRALHEAPARRSAACCGRPAAPATQDGRTASECTRLLGFSAAQGALKLDEGLAQACEAALEARRGARRVRPPGSLRAAAPRGLRPGSAGPARGRGGLPFEPGV
jgi:hypothetical protein